MLFLHFDVMQGYSNDLVLVLWCLFLSLLYATSSRLLPNTETNIRRR